MRRALGALAAIGLACTASASAGPGDVWKKLHRPLHIPRIDSEARCPVSKNIESAPVYPVLAREDGNPVLRFDFRARPGSIDYGSPWSGQKVMWVVRPKHRAPMLIRGRQLDGARVLRFEHGQIPRTERRLPGARTGQERRYPSTTRIRAPGCYGYQVDGPGFSHVFVFEAKLSGPVNVDEVLDALRARGLPMEPAGPFRSMGFDYLVRITGQRFENPAGEIVLWQFPTFRAVHGLLIQAQGRDVEVLTKPAGSVIAAIFCVVDPATPETCDFFDVPPPHWYRNGTALALYLGSDPATLKTMEDLLGEQFAGEPAGGVNS